MEHPTTLFEVSFTPPPPKKTMETQRQHQQLEEKHQIGPRNTAEGEMSIHDKITLWRRKENESGDMDSFRKSMDSDTPDTSRSFGSGPQDRQAAGIQRHRPDKTPQKGPDVFTVPSIDDVHQYGSDVDESCPASAVESLEGTCSLISEESQDNGETLAKYHPFTEFKEMAVNRVMDEFFLWKDKQRETNAEGAQHSLQDPLKLNQTSATPA
ncbi:hypothetical protein F5883DRAFT_49936 [Diaporthe sp. PMI_573]|nr:hypothetical protein F5883DRAFT_49936 [Diaporthaceae sp. PMI_573]